MNVKLSLILIIMYVVIHVLTTIEVIENHNYYIHILLCLQGMKKTILFV